jgi:DNA-binding NarL/FixJ family response regulator
MRALIVADNALAAEVIRRGLRYAPTCRVLGFVGARRPCGDTIAQASPDVIVFDDSSEAGAVVARIREARQAAPEAKLVMLTLRMEPDELAQASAAGIDAAIAKTAQPQSVGMLVREVAAGNVFHAFAKPPAAAQPTHSAADDLTARELEILRLMAAGSSNGRIAAQLWVTEQTVKFHLSNIYRKLGVANRTQASHYAHVHGLLEPAAVAPVAAAA